MAELAEPSAAGDATVVALAAHLVALPLPSVLILAQQVPARRYWLPGLRDADSTRAHASDTVGSKPMMWLDAREIWDRLAL